MTGWEKMGLNDRCFAAAFGTHFDARPRDSVLPLTPPDEGGLPGSSEPSLSPA